MKPKLYLETTIASYLVARPSREPTIRARQLSTGDWWKKRLADFEIYISDVVRLEAGAGDPVPAAKRMALIRTFPVLEATSEAKELTDALVGPGLLPAKAIRDAAHLGIAAANGMHFLLTWNFRHIANAEILQCVETVCEEHGFKCPAVCTPDELMGV